jgi:hypothetical protein
MCACAAADLVTSRLSCCAENCLLFQFGTGDEMARTDGRELTATGSVNGNANGRKSGRTVQAASGSVLAGVMGPSPSCGEPAARDPGRLGLADVFCSEAVMRLNRVLRRLEALTWVFGTPYELCSLRGGDENVLTGLHCSLVLALQVIIHSGLTSATATFRRHRSPLYPHCVPVRYRNSRGPLHMHAVAHVPVVGCKL